MTPTLWRTVIIGGFFLFGVLPVCLAVDEVTPAGRVITMIGVICVAGAGGWWYSGALSAGKNALHVQTWQVVSWLLIPMALLALSLSMRANAEPVLLYFVAAYARVTAPSRGRRRPRTGVEWLWLLMAIGALVGLCYIVLSLDSLVVWAIQWLAG